MCCFSQPVDYVTNTRLYARWLPQVGAERRQVLVYQMDFGAQGDLAMILPLPVPPNSSDKAVSFINLSAYPDFFEHFPELFPEPPAMRSFGAKQAVAPVPEPLEVVKVGEFEASFVPRQVDFVRLDPRFRINPEAWKKLPIYQDYGFAVFKLRSPKRTLASLFRKENSKDRKVHPMAFSFPRRTGNTKLFFPTVHIHDGEVHEQEEFDHILYAQGLVGAQTMQWEESARLLSAVMKDDVKGLIDPNGHLFRRKILGLQKNADIWA